jgi:hypothetical protein
VGAPRLHMLIDIQQSIGHQFHPQLFDLMNYLELQFVVVDEVIKGLLTRK